MGKTKVKMSKEKKRGSKQMSKNESITDYFKCRTKICTGQISMTPGKTS